MHYRPRHHDWTKVPVKRFRTKPVEVDAIKWTGDNAIEIREWTGERVVDSHAIPLFCEIGTYLSPDLNRGFTAEVFDVLHNTWIAVATGQYIVKGAKGEFYPCDDETFHWKYEEVK